MTQANENATAFADRASGAAAMERLADRLITMAPQPMELSQASIVRQSPAVAAGLSASAAIARRAHERAQRSQRPILTTLVESFVSACKFIPYSAVALLLRLMMARVFFLDGQTRIDGIRFPVNVAELTKYYINGFDFSVTVPTQLRPETFTAFMTQYPLVPVPPAISAYLVSYAEFVLPIMLVIGLGTRFVALGLLVITGVILAFVAADPFSALQLYWAALLLVLVTQGPGAASADHLIRRFFGRAP
ncbi:MAG: DoxX family protein [Pseudolabrys sp.]|jgi:putative oxidoreductase